MEWKEGSQCVLLGKVVIKHVLKVPSNSNLPEIKQAWDVTQNKIQHS